jgi:hypothetical protein
MAVLLLPSRRIRQPKIASDVVWDGPLSRGLQLVNNGPALNVKSSGARLLLPSWAGSGISYGYSPLGVSVISSGASTAAARYDTGYTIADTSACTLEFLIYPTATASLAAAGGFSTLTTTDGQFNNGSVNGSIRGVLSYGGSSPYDLYFWAANNDYDSTKQWVLGAAQHIVITKASGTGAVTINVYRNGVLAASGNSGNGSAFYQSGPYWYLFGRHNSASATITGAIAKAALYDCMLGAAEVGELYAAPWAQLKPNRGCLYFGAGAATQNATATGATVSAAASAVVGSTTASSQNAAATVSATASTVVGAVTAASSATGATVSATASTIAGSAKADFTAGGQTVSSTASAIPGTATAGQVAAGQTITATASAIAGTESADAIAAGATVSATASAIPGTATGATAGTAEGATVSATASAIAGSVTATAQNTAAIVTATASAIAGSATGGSNATANGVTVTAAASVIAGSVVGGASAGGATVNAAADFIAGALQASAQAQAAIAIATASAIAGLAYAGIMPVYDNPLWQSVVRSSSPRIGGSPASADDSRVGHDLVLADSPRIGRSPG